jgi:hypothetical protein
MSGNLYEWCSDWFGDYPVQPVIDPAGPPEGHERVLRGGSWFHFGRFLRSADRRARTPGLRDHYLGVRLAGGCDPQAGQGTRAMSADRWERSDRRSGGQGTGDGEKDGDS